MLLSRSLTLAVPIAVLGCALLAGGCDRESGSGAQPQAGATQASAATYGRADRSRQGTPLPDLTVSDAKGETLDLASLKGRPALINLWATWCAPCVVELPTLDRLASRTGPDLQVVTISQDMGEPEQVQAFLDRRGLDRLPGWLDPRNDVSFHYGVGVLPMTVLYDAQGREVWRYAGDLDWTGEQAAILLRERCRDADSGC